MNIADTNTTVRRVTPDDLKILNELDALSGNYVSECVEDEDYGFLLVDNDNNALGYCTIGYTDDIDSDIDAHPLHDCDSLLISDVFIRREYRRNGYGSKLVEDAVRLKKETVPDSRAVFLTLLDNELGEFYNRLGFENIDEYSMFKRL